MVAISIHRYDLFLTASRLLQRYRQLTPELKPIAVELALAIQWYQTHAQKDCSQSPLPWIGSESGMSLTRIAQDICDPFYTKSHLYLPTTPQSWGVETRQNLVWPIFNQDREGILQPLAPSHLGGKFTERRWLKACNSQEGIGCHALAAHLWQDESFLAEDRDLCPFRLYSGHYPLNVDQGRQTCGFDDHPCGWKAGLPKMLQVIGKGRTAEVLQAHWTPDMWQMLIPRHRPIPVYPLIVMIYFGHVKLAQGRTTLTPEQFVQDLGLPMVQARQLFNQDPTHPLNETLLRQAQQPPPDYSVSHALTTWRLPPLNQPTGGRIVLDPDEPPHFHTSGLPSGASTDPLLAERRRRRQLERTPYHNEILHHFRRWFRLAGLEVREDHQFFDFLAVTRDSLLLAEVKSLYHQDMSEAIQEVVGQLLYYERFALGPWLEQGYSVQKAAVFNRPPLGDYIDFLQDLGIATYWLTEDHRIDGPEDSLRYLRYWEIQVAPDPELSGSD